MPDIKDQPPEKKGDPNKKFVVLHGRVGHTWENGDVISEAQIGPDNLPRLLELGAVREADTDEAKLLKVSVVNADAPKNLSHESQMAEKDRQIENLLAQKADLQVQMNAQKAQEVAQRQASEPTQAMKDKVLEKDRRIAELEQQLADAKGKAANVGGGDPGDENKAGRKSGK